MQLREWMDSKGITARRVATAVGVSPAMIRYILTGQRKPSIRLIAAFEDLTRGKVRWRDWRAQMEKTNDSND